MRAIIIIIITEWVKMKGRRIHSQIIWKFSLIGFVYCMSGASQVALPMQETKETSVWSLGGEDPLEEGMERHSSILAWKIPWTEDPGGLQTIGLQRVRHNWSDLACIYCIYPRSLSYAYLDPKTSRGGFSELFDHRTSSPFLLLFFLSWSLNDVLWEIGVIQSRV